MAFRDDLKSFVFHINFGKFFRAILRFDEHVDVPVL